jgi:GNAT superfamily N-acetyltransferase
MHIDIRPMNAENPHEVEAARDIYNAAMAEDVPDFKATSMAEFAGRMRHPWPGQHSSRWIASLDDVPAGLLMVNLPTLDNLHTAGVDLVVHPRHRRRGVGRALYETATEHSRANDRRTLLGSYVTQLPDGPTRSAGHQAFAEMVGAKSALPEVRRRLDVDTVDRAAWPGLLEDSRSRADGYTVVAWTDRSPDDIVAGLAELDSRFLAEAPLGELDLEPLKVDADRVRAGEETSRKRGGRNYHVAARHDATGFVAAWTHIAFEADAETHAWQEITIVDRAHRGHRLGMLVKMENLLRTIDAEPGLRYVDTWNAAENAHMIAINEAMGFRPVDGWVSWQQEI